MNLIEQLGGYDKCKDLLLIPNIDMIMNAQGLRDALLQHRIENNIFEMGDYIIFENELLCFAMWSSLNPDYAYIGYPYDEDGAMVHKSRFRHATDAEIKAGRRL